MTRCFLATTVFAAALAVASPAVSQDAASHDGHAAASAESSAPLPAACTAAAPAAEGANAPSMESGAAAPGGSPAGDMDAVQAGNTAAMSAMHGPMMQAAMIRDADLAFNCGMIAHHLGAIAMSKVELEHGKDAQSRALAEGIIAAQQKEIADMTAWIEAHAK
ncbi:hypothetical protein ASG43_06855 [Aureimonas sp. Leaf454]|uniref:CopM family metallochaperone n=1 Tax=Aureimonas sp. Leaf454 TaxID=1736381 RepID=UPI000701DA38|nr:DUF305 domain-containing protein [Aureimonas sp. Leaf454]KQT50961.1 hypothetical protein ASG43_06855 [Aureimonas sp. Leaf454]